MKKALLCLFLMATALCISAGAQIADLRNRFHHPDDQARPWCFWYWMNGAVSLPGIRADLHAMKQVGLGGAYLMPIRDSSRFPEFAAPLDQLTPEWWHAVGYALQQADSLGLQLGMHICDGFALAGGPWITPEESMQKVVWTDTIVEGAKIASLVLPQPESYRGFYRDLRTVAIPLAGRPDTQRPRLSVAQAEIDADGTIRATAPCAIVLAYERPFTCRSVQIAPAGNNFQAQRLRLEASDDGLAYTPVKTLTPARQGWQQLGIPFTWSVPPTTARYFRFTWSPEGTEPGSEDLDAAKWKATLKVKRITLSDEARINQWEGKSGIVWRIADQTDPREVGASDCVPLGRLIDLTGQLHGDTLRSLTLPAGQTWRILRMGHTSTGMHNDTGGRGKGLECDKFNAAAVRKQVENWFGAVFTHTDPAVARRVLKFMHVDSWECASQNWGAGFAAQFAARRGYDLLPYLPLLAGVPLEDARRSEKVLLDVRTTIAELTSEVFFATVAECAKKWGCELSAECTAPTMVTDGMEHFQYVDRPMGEFWLQSPTHDKPSDMLEAISGAHIYGKKLIQSEGFTQVRGVWNEHPAMLKPLLDRQFALGTNKLFYHVFAHNPYLDRAPGITLEGIGLFFQRDQTWFFDGGKAFTDYVSRCQALLQYGTPVADVAVFTGEEIPRRAILPDRLLPWLPGIFGREKVNEEKRRLANDGQPTRELPVGVTASSGITTSEDWVNPLRGYAYDSFNKDALLRLAKMENGRMVLPGGASYRILILPLSRPMNPNAGLYSPPVRRKIDELSAKGLLIPVVPFLEEDFSDYGLPPDVVVPKNIAWTHRRGDQADIVFLSNQTDTLRTFTATLRISGRTAELWNPVTGSITPARYKEVDGRTRVQLGLAPYESVFIVLPAAATPFSEKTAARQALPGRRASQTQPLEAASWQISFPKTGVQLRSDTLLDWRTASDDRIRYYSGTACYQTEFTWNGEIPDDVFLRFEHLCNVATVRLNDIPCGTVWTAPYRADITRALRKGLNKLTIEVTNTWANALLGKELGKAPFEGIWTNARYRMKEKALIPAGLFGKITVERW
ncbi:MAG: DNA-binding protein [Prevotellaceae bacterium]|jgi:hypothetical protein|nr:DNA-binding protein [Prevotellaceae bacterium]